MTTEQRSKETPNKVVAAIRAAESRLVQLAHPGANELDHAELWVWCKEDRRAYRRDWMRLGRSARIRRIGVVDRTIDWTIRHAVRLSRWESTTVTIEEAVTLRAIAEGLCDGVSPEHDAQCQEAIAVLGNSWADAEVPGDLSRPVLETIGRVASIAARDLRRTVALFEGQPGDAQRIHRFVRIAATCEIATGQR